MEIYVKDTDKNGEDFLGCVFLWEQDTWVHHTVIHVVRFDGVTPKGWIGTIEKTDPEMIKRMNLTAFELYNKGERYV